MQIQHHQIDTEALWPALLELRESMHTNPDYAEKIKSWHLLRDSGGRWMLREDEQSTAWVLTNKLISLNLQQDLPANFFDTLGLAARYLELLQQQYNYSQSNEFQVTASCAQSLDGFIATNTGDSQWIGNKQNLVHAHKLRALHDGILVGSGTLLNDAPQLTVRHVEGKNPSRFLVTRNPSQHQKALGKLVTPGTYVLYSQKLTTPNLPEAICFHHIEKTGDDGFLLPQDIVTAIKALGLRSLLIEGGGKTLSHFLKANLIQSADVQIAPILLGDGVRPFATPAVAKISESKVFPARTFTLNTQVLLSMNLTTDNLTTDNLTTDNLTTDN